MRSMRQIRARWSTAAGSVGVALLLAATQGTAAAGAATSAPRAACPGGTGPDGAGT